MDKGHIDMLRSAGDHAGEDAGLRSVLRLGLDIQCICVGHGYNVLPQILQGLFQLCSGQIAQILIRIDLQPQKQRFLRQNVRVLGVDG